MLSKKEIEKLAALIKRIPNPHQGLPQPVFDALIKTVPFIACELIVAGKDGLLLTWRDDEFWQGWHFPGGLMRYRESFKERLNIVAQKELGAKISSYRFLSLKNCPNGERGHCLSLVFLCRLDHPPKNGKFFKKIPTAAITEHKKVWREIIKLAAVKF